MKEYSSESGKAIADTPDHIADASNMVPAVDQFAHLPLSVIVPSLTNPRKTFDPAKLAELAESIKASGVHQPILVRPLPGSRLEETAWEPRSLRQRSVRPTHEIVAGERRYRAATLAALATIPAMIRAMTDEQVLECQLVENLQRDDLSPLEEAEGYEHLCAATGISKDDVGAKIGKSRAYVYARIKLLDLSQDCKQALQGGAIDPSRALLIARIPDTALQTKALAEATRKSGNGDVISLRDLQTWLQKNVMLRLENATFKITDSRLVKDAGSCKDCPKRTGAAPDLFADVDGADICTDPACYHGKEAAHRAALVAQAEKKGLRLVDGKEAAEICSRYNSSALRGYLPLSQVREDAARMLGSMTEGVRSPTLRDLLGKDAPGAVLIAHPYTGEMIEAVPDAQTEALLITRGLIKASAQQVKQQESAEAEIEYLRSTIGHRTGNAASEAKYEAVLAGIRATPDSVASSLITSDLLRAWLESILGNGVDEEEMADLLGYTFEDGQDQMDALSMHIRACSHGTLYRALVIYMAKEASPYGYSSNDPIILDALYQPLRIDTAAIDAQAKATVRAEVAEKIKQLKAEAKPAKSPPPLASAAQAVGGGGAKAQSQKPKTPAAPARKKKMSAPEAQAAIAAAMQGQDTDTGAADASQGIDASPEPGSGFALPVGAPDEPATPCTDPLYQRALQIVTVEQKVSVRLLKAGLGIGTTKALELVNALAQAGMVSACDERGSRRVLVVA